MNDRCVRPLTLGLDFVADDSRCRAFACSGSRSSTGAPSTSASGRCALDGRNGAAHRRHRLGQVDAGRRGHDAAGAGAPHRLQQGRRRRQPRAHAALLRARPLQVRAQRSRRARARPVALRDAQQLLGHPRRLPQRRLRPDGDAGAGVLAEGPAGPAGALLRGAPSAALSIADDFADFGTDIAAAAQEAARARAPRSRTASRRTARWFRRRFGIDNEQALELFHQTVSMKSVGNLTDFVRSHMLEPFDVAPRIAGADRALRRPEPRARGGAEGQAAGRAARRRWSPIATATPSWSREIEQLRACRDALRPYFARLKAGLARQAPRTCWPRSWRALDDADRAPGRAARRRSAPRSTS